MVTQPSESSQYVMNVHTGEIGLVNGKVISPSYAEEVQGIERVHVTTFMPSAIGLMFETNDYWLPEDCWRLPNIRVKAGATARFVTNRGVMKEGIVLSARPDEICVMLPDGRTGWVYFRYVVSVVSVVSPLTSSVAQIA